MASNTRVVRVGHVLIGGGHAVSVQTMWKDPLVEAELDQVAVRIGALAALGCAVLRFAVPDMAAARLLGRLAGLTDMPLVADIHFDWRIALCCLDYPVAKIRINPGNIGASWKVRELAAKAADKGVPIRIGVNAGSLPKDLAIRYTQNSGASGAPGAATTAGASDVVTTATTAGAPGASGTLGAPGAATTAGAADVVTTATTPIMPTVGSLPGKGGVGEKAAVGDPGATAGVNQRAATLVEAAEREVAALDAMNFRDVVVSMKASSVAETVACNRLFAARHDIPLHIGVTEAGPLIQGCIRSAVALHELLAAGIGDTMRISLSADMESEVIAGREILALATGVRHGVELVSCPRCARAGFDTHGFAARWRDRLLGSGKNLTVAVMGCVVNGPGESRHADVGISGAGDKVIIFRHGQIVRTCAPEDADTVFWEEFNRA
jgi:4-hydroxy-3-methylbut-2-en-1-yl diphosphate synthase IspG/GcpE